MPRICGTKPISGKWFVFSGGIFEKVSEVSDCVGLGGMPPAHDHENLCALCARKNRLAALAGPAGVPVQQAGVPAPRICGTKPIPGKWFVFSGSIFEKESEVSDCVGLDGMLPAHDHENLCALCASKKRRAALAGPAGVPAPRICGTNRPGRACRPPMIDENRDVRAEAREAFLSDPLF